VFQTRTTEGHLKRLSVHQGRGQALMVLTWIRVLAFTLTLVFFYRQVRSHFRNCSLGFCDLARFWLYARIPVERPGLLFLKTNPTPFAGASTPFLFPPSTGPFVAFLSYVSFAQF
jgi:hypothetical protein